MKNLLNTIIKYLNEDLNKLGELNKLLSEEIIFLEKAKNEQKEDNKLISLEEKLMKKINEKERRIDDYKLAFKTAKEMLLTFYKERIIKCIETYNMLRKLDEKSRELGLKQYSKVLEDGDMHFFNYYYNRLYFRYHGTRNVENEKIIIDSTFYLYYNKENNDLTLNINNRNEYTCDNNLTLAIKDYLVVIEMVNEFEKFEEKVNKLVEEILEEE